VLRGRRRGRWVPAAQLCQSALESRSSWTRCTWSPSAANAGAVRLVLPGICSAASASVAELFLVRVHHGPQPLSSKSLSAEWARDDVRWDHAEGTASHRSHHLHLGARSAPSVGHDQCKRRGQDAAALASAQSVKYELWHSTNESEE